jgi:hypothetical protein
MASASKRCATSVVATKSKAKHMGYCFLVIIAAFLFFRRKLQVCG